MVKKSLRKNTFREIRQSFGRFIAILAIVALGVGFFAGLKVTKQAMIETADTYFRDNSLYDFRLISTLGLTEENVEAIRALDFVKEAEGAMSSDVLVLTGSGAEAAVKLLSYSEKINRITLTAGRLPEKPGECVVDNNWFSPDHIGEKLILSDSNKSETLDNLASSELTVVGVCKSSAYVNFERGTTGLGSGKLSGFIVVLPEEFTCDYFTDIYVVTNAGEKRIYTKEYDDLIDNQTDLLEPGLQLLADKRYDDLYAEAEEKIADAQAEIDDADSQIADAEQKLKDANQDIADGEKELEENETKISDGEKEIADAEKEIADNEKKISDGEKELADAEEKIKDGEKELGIAKNQYYEGLNSYNSALAEYESFKAAYDALPPYMQPFYSALLAIYEEELHAAGEQLRIARTQIDENEELILDAKKEIAEKKQEIADAKEKIRSAKEDIEEAKIELEDGKTKIEDGKVKIEDAKKEVEDATSELEEHKKELADAKIKLSDARKDLDDFEKPDTYVLTRGTNIGYACFENDSDIVEGIGNVFPIFFFLVAALVCMTTMSRMVEEQRTQIGVMKALGYNEASIMGKYLFYSGSGAIVGCIGGYFAGCFVFPLVIWKAYNIMYNMRDIIFVFDKRLAIISIAVSVLCSMGATYITLVNELRSNAADLIRPKAPKNGKRVFLERIGFIWNRIKFTGKVSIRNAFRYKKRFFMMILGVGGCYGLLITGMGIKDSIADVCDCQFKDIQQYGITVNFKDDMPDEDRDKFSAKLGDVHFIYSQSKTLDVVYDNRFKSATMVVFSDSDKDNSGSDYIKFVNSKNNPIPLPGVNEAIITEKMAKMLGISLGDEVILRDSDLNEIRVTVSGITKNYVYNWVYIIPETYSSQMKKEPYFNTALVKSDSEELAVELRNLDSVTSVSVSEEMSKRIGNMMESLNQIVILVILCAAALAFIVMYNLTNINITERLREIATLKVLGFYPMETALYVFRENIILTVLGIIVGLFMGRGLHAYVMYNINVEVVSFDTKILPLSYFYGVILTFIFALIVDLVLSIKLEKIKMAESLKSVE